MSTLVPFKKGFLANLKARIGLTGVQVMYSDDVETIGNEAMWFTTAATDSLEFVSLRTPPQKMHEVYTVTLVVQVLKTQGESQEAADDRAVELISEVQAELSEKPQQIPEIMFAKFNGWTHRVGALGSGHGSGFECRVQVQARK